MTTPQVASPQDLQQCGSVSNYHSLFISFFLLSVSLSSPAVLFYCSGITETETKAKRAHTHTDEPIVFSMRDESSSACHE